MYMYLDYCTGLPNYIFLAIVHGTIAVIVVVVERKLLDPALIPHKLEIKASSVLHPENSEKYSILQFTGPSQYWKPSNNGASSYIDIDLKSNHNITAVELRGMSD